MSVGFWDVALVAAVTAHVAVVAYLYDPKWKAFALTLPVPFTLTCLALNGHAGKALPYPIDASNVLSLLVLLLFTNAVRWLHYDAGIRIVASILLATIGCCAIAAALAPHVPKDSVTFFAASAVVVVLAIVVLFNSPHVVERGYRTPLPIYVKLPGIAAIVIVLVLIKSRLGGFMTSFPMVTVFAAYESRHSLATLCRQIPVLLLTLLPMTIVVRLLQHEMGLGPSLAVAWLVFVIIVYPMNSLTRLGSKKEELVSKTEGDRDEDRMAGWISGRGVDGRA